MENKHTPGPWAYKRTHELSHDTWYVIIDFNGRGPVFDIGGRDLNGQIAEAKYLVTDPEEIEANARLIAAAPELLEALKLTLPFLESAGIISYSGIGEFHEHFGLGNLEKVKSAIAKAEGK